MGVVIKFTFDSKNKVANFGNKSRKSLTSSGCNEPFKDRYWCPKQKWFKKTHCGFLNRRECENYEIQCIGRCF